MDFTNLSGSFGSNCYTNFISQLNQSNSKYLQDEETRRRKRNEDLLAKIQQLRLSLSLEASRSEILRQMQNEHRVLVQKYLQERNLPSYPKTTDPDPYYDRLRLLSRDLAPPTSKPFNSERGLYISTGINTDLTGPVGPIHAISNHENERYIPMTKSDGIENPDKNFNHPLATNTMTPKLELPSWTPKDLNLELRRHSLSIPSLGYDHIQNGTMVSVKNNNFSTNPIPTFLDFSTTSESEISSRAYHPEGTQIMNTQRIVMDSTSTAVTTTMSKILASDETSEISTSLPISRKPSIPIPGMQRIPSQEVLLSPLQSFSKEDNNARRHEVSNDIVIVEKERHHAIEHVESPTTTIGESLMNSFHQTMQNSISKDDTFYSKKTDEVESDKRNDDDDTESVTNGSNWINDVHETQKPSSLSSQKYEIKLTSEKMEDINHPKNETRNVEDTNTDNDNLASSDTDDLSYAPTLPPLTQLKVGESQLNGVVDSSPASNPLQRSSEDTSEASSSKEEKNQVQETKVEIGATPRAQPVRLKLGYEDSESEVSEHGSSKPVQKITAEDTKNEPVKKTKTTTAEDEDDDLDDFFDL